MHPWIRFACKIAVANKSRDKNFSFGAVLIKSGKVQSTGTNKIKTDPLVYQLTQNYKRKRQWVHAEMDCIKLPIDNTKNGVVYVARLTKLFDVANAEPCDMCKQKMIEAGIKRVHFTISNEKEGIIYFRNKFSKEEILVNNEGINFGRNDHWKKQ